MWFDVYDWSDGFGIAANIRVGNLLGMGKHQVAKTAHHILSWFDLDDNMFCVDCCFRQGHRNVYTDGDKDIADLVVVLAPLASTFQVFDALLGICNGVLRAWEAENFGNYKHDFAVGDWGDLRHVACICNFLAHEGYLDWVNEWSNFQRDDVGGDGIAGKMAG